MRIMGVSRLSINLELGENGGKEHLEGAQFYI